jgi:hypothetical protein
MGIWLWLFRFTMFLFFCYECVKIVDGSVVCSRWGELKIFYFQTYRTIRYVFTFTMDAFT